MKCSDLKKYDSVIFKRYCDILEREDYENRSVVYTDNIRQIVSVCYLEGYKSRTDEVPFSKMVAIYDPDGEVMKFGTFEGESQLLQAM